MAAKIRRPSGRRKTYHDYTGFHPSPKNGHRIDWFGLLEYGAVLLLEACPFTLSYARFDGAAYPLLAQLDPAPTFTRTTRAGSDLIAVRYAQKKVDVEAFRAARAQALAAGFDDYVVWTQDNIRAGERLENAEKIVYGSRGPANIESEDLVRAAVEQSGGAASITPITGQTNLAKQTIPTILHLLARAVLVLTDPAAPIDENARVVLGDATALANPDFAVTPTDGKVSDYDRAAADAATQAPADGAEANRPVSNPVGRCFESFTEEQREDGYRKLEYVKLSELLFQRFNIKQDLRPDLLRPIKRYTLRPETGYQNAVDCIARFRRIRAAHELNKRPSELPLEKYNGNSLRNWRNKYVESGANIAALVQRDDKKGYRQERLADEVVKVLEKRITKTFLKTKKAAVPKLRDLIDADLSELKRKNPAATALSVPSKSTITRRIAKKATPEKTKRLRDGVGKARQTYGRNHPAPRPTRPYQIVEIDITPIDILFVEYDADGNVIAKFRPYLIAVIDKFTGAVLAFWLGRARPNAATVARVLRRAMRPKRPDGTLTPAPAAGLIESLVVDGGGEFIETLLLAALDENRIGYRLCRAGAANLKGAIEQTFRTAASDVCAEPGRTFSNPVKKGDYDAEANAVLELEDGIRILDLYFGDVRHNSAAEGTTRPTPITSFRANEDKILTPEFYEYKFAALLLDQKTAIITSKGIRYDSLFYDTKKSGVIAALHRELGEGAAITIKPNDDDLTQLVAICPLSGVRLFVPLVSLDDVAGRSREQVHAQREADLAVNGEKEGRPALLAARLEIERVVKAAEKKRRKAKASKNVAAPVAAIDDSPAPPAPSKDGDAFLPIEPLEGAADDGSDEPSPLFDWA